MWGEVLHAGELLAELGGYVVLISVGEKWVFHFELEIGFGLAGLAAGLPLRVFRFAGVDKVRGAGGDHWKFSSQL